jgi:hypothetical protein
MAQYYLVFSKVHGKSLQVKQSYSLNLENESIFLYLASFSVRNQFDAVFTKTTITFLYEVRFWCMTLKFFKKTRASKCIHQKIKVGRLPCLAQRRASPLGVWQGYFEATLARWIGGVFRSSWLVNVYFPGGGVGLRTWRLPHSVL